MGRNFMTLVENAIESRGCREWREYDPSGKCSRL